MDGTYIGKRWKYHKLSMPHQWGQTVWFRAIERDWTPKGRHRRLTWLVKAESIECCLPLLKEHCKIGAKLMADGCGFGRSTKLRELFIVDQCNHKRNEYVKPGTESFDSHNKVHDNTAESSFQYDKILKAKSYGHGQRIA
eukprot:326221_1